jgi:flagellar basal body-associated protein FliL
LTIVSSQSVLKERSLKKILLSVLVLLIAAAAGLFAYLPLKKPDMAESSAIRASKAPRNASLAASIPSSTFAVAPTAIPKRSLW